MATVFTGFDFKVVQTANASSKGIGGIPEPYSFDPDWETFLKKNSFGPSLEIFELYLLMAVYYRHDAKTSTASYLDAKSNELKGEPLISDVKTISTKIGPGNGPLHFKNEYPAKLFLIGPQQWAGAPVRFFDLVGCNLPKLMRERNFVNYYRSRRMDIDCGRIIAFITFAAANSPDFADQLRQEKKNDAFIQYHTTAQSTGGLLGKMTGTLGADMKAIFKFSDDDLGDIKFVSENPTLSTATMRLKPRVMMVFFAFLRTFGMFPDNYYWGQRNEEAVKGGLYSKYMAGMKRYKEITLNTEAIATMTKDQLASLF